MKFYAIITLAIITCLFYFQQVQYNELLDRYCDLSYAYSNLAQNRPILERFTSRYSNPIAEEKNAVETIVEPIWAEFTITAYCVESYYHICNDGNPSQTATGTKPTPGRTIAVDPDVIALGSTVEIDGMGIYMAEDTGGAIKGNKIDIAFETHQEALNFGKQTMKARIINE